MAKSTRSARTRHAGRADVMQVWETPKQSWPVAITGMLIRWRAELALTVVLVVYLMWLPTDDRWLLTLAVVGPIVVVMAIPWSRRVVVARCWCVLDRHRIRTCLRNAKIRTMNLDGALPFLLWARPTKTGERVWVWIRAGSSADDIESVLSYIAPACYAREARLHRAQRLSTLVAVDIVRRNPLAKKKAIDSPLTVFTSGADTTLVEGSEPITAATVIPQPVSSEPAASAGVRSKKPAKTAAAKPTASDVESRPAVMVGGEDVSDYID
ncbi:MAG: hypothetical protein GEV04_15310 [Actinophytocola sp.]|nr:hypothetical protein [Actinophytocola sp.]